MQDFNFQENCYTTPFESDKSQGLFKTWNFTS